MAAATALVEVFGNLSESLKAIKEQLLDGGEFPNALSDLDTFWNHIDACMKYVSQEATKLSLACSQPPYPTSEEISPLLRSIENACINLASAYLNLNASVYGVTLKSCVKARVESIMDGLVELLGNLSESCSKKRSKYLQTTGKVWDVSDKFSSMPKNNRDAVVSRLRTILDLIEDAYSELNGAIRESLDEGKGTDCDVIDELEEDNFPTRWSVKEELDMAKASLGLVKTLKACLTKIAKAIETNGCTNASNPRSVPVSDSVGALLNRLSLDDVDNTSDVSVKYLGPFSNPIAQLDAVSSLASTSGNIVDDLILSLYPPTVEVESIRYKVEEIGQLLRDLLELARSSHFVLPADASWVEFLGKAIQHNTEKTLKTIEVWNQEWHKKLNGM